ncbi:bifunctional enoyl-CoA hydratase/phosphate acetyltransferase [Massilia sp. W12]|uniref:bifunctional enoyl-CoA hydratase/phosphate acetyltransferase n=1 Tax=Massilia sp. W12 TaxID=3126507 RepID=UPI0030D32C2C
MHQAPASSEFIENITYDDLTIGRSACLVRRLSVDDILAFAAISGDVNPAHVDAEYAENTLFHGVIAHGMWGGALISTLLGASFPGPGTIYVEQSLRFLRPMRIGDTLTVQASVVARDDQKKRVTLDCQIANQQGVTVISGTAVVIAPVSKVRRPRVAMPQLQLFDPHARWQALLAQVKGWPALSCAFVHPCHGFSLQAALDARELGLLQPVLVGPRAKILAAAEAAGLDIRDLPIHDAPHSHAACELALDMAQSGQVAALFKGSVQAQELMHALLARPALLSKYRLSHIVRFDLPGRLQPLLLTDAGINVAPDLMIKADIVQNAIRLAQAYGVPTPKVAILAAQDTININLPSTLDAAALCKMAERGQISGADLDGPLDLGQVLSQAAEDAVDILLAPDLESAHLLARQWQTQAGAMHSGLVLGARIPVILCDDSAGPRSASASAALAQLLNRHLLQYGI